MAGSGEGLDDGAVGNRVMSKVGLLRGPVEEAEGEGVVAQEERVDDGGDELRRELRWIELAVEGLLERGSPCQGSQVWG